MSHTPLQTSLLLLSVCCACLDPQDSGAPRDQTPRASHSLTVADQTQDAFSLPMPGLGARHLSSFFVGNSLFNQNWVAAPATVSERDGLGPLFNARSCSTCHFKDGRGRPQEHDELPSGVLLRISLPGPSGESVPHPVYGDQLQTQALPGLVAEVTMRTEYVVQQGAYADGEPYQLRAPRYVLSNEGYGPLGGELQLSARVAPATLGLGLLEAVPVAVLQALADPDDRDGNGISGRVSRLADGQAGAIGRFGWKAEQPTVCAQTAAAFLGDMGIGSTLLPGENHTAGQPMLAQLPSGGVPELSDQALAHVVTYMRTLAVPAPRALGSAPGEQLFRALGCADCHLPTLRTGPVPDLPELSHAVFHPFTDLLLHDMGEGLSDGRPTGNAQAREWRTAPLWGLGLLPKVNGHQLLLHDGRARGVAEAILWHGGEAQRARAAFQRLPRSEREALVQYVSSL